MENKRTRYYSPGTGGFYDPAIHGSSIPKDCVEVPEDQYKALFAAQANGKRIKPGKDGQPTAVDQEPLTGNDLVLSKIYEIEATITPRRLREGALGLDGGWLKAADDQIAALRKQMKK